MPRGSLALLFRATTAGTACQEQPGSSLNGLGSDPQKGRMVFGVPGPTKDVGWQGPRRLNARCFVPRFRRYSPDTPAARAAAVTHRRTQAFASGTSPVTGLQAKRRNPAVEGFRSCLETGAHNAGIDLHGVQIGRNSMTSSGRFVFGCLPRQRSTTSPPATPPPAPHPSKRPGCSAYCSPSSPAPPSPLPPAPLSQTPAAAESAYTPSTPQ